MSLERLQVVIEVRVAGRDAKAATVTDTASPRELTRDEVRVTQRGEYIIRIQPDGRVDRVARVGSSAAMIATDRILVVVSREDLGKQLGGDAIAMRLIGPTDAYRLLTLPPWLAGKGEDIDLALAEDDVVIRTTRFVARIPIERLNWLARVGNARIKFCARSDRSPDATVVVTRGGDARAVVEGANGKRIMLMTQAVPVVIGERLFVREMAGEFALVNGAGEKVGHDDTIELVRTPADSSSSYPDHDTFCEGRISATDFAADVLKPEPRAILEKLETLGIAPGLDREALEDATLDAFRSHRVPMNAALVAAEILYAHLRSHPHRQSRALVGADAIERAARENSSLGETRWHLVTMTTYEPFALLLSPAIHRAVTDRELLVLEPVPPYETPPADAEAIRAMITKLLGASDSELRVETTRGGRISLRMSVRAAAILERTLVD